MQKKSEARLVQICCLCQQNFSNEEKVAVVFPITSVDVTCSEAMLGLSLSTLLVKCLTKILGRSALG